MALIVEDGTIVEDANSYVTLEEARAYALERGLTLPALPEEGQVDALEALLISAVDYLEGKRVEYKGEKVSELQELQFPRDNVYIDGFLLASDAIPKVLKQAQIKLAVIAHSGVALEPVRSGPAVIRKKVGPIETEYSEGSTFRPAMPAVDALLAPLLNCGHTLRVIRV